jgi:hypothetical protein
MNRAFYIAGVGYVAICVALIVRHRPAPFVARVAPTPAHLSGSPYRGNDAAEWFRQAKPFCNAVEAAVRVRQLPPPQTLDGAGFGAACFALGGKMDLAQRTIDSLPANARPRAAGIVFEVGHPVADAGDDRSAGPIMELVVRYIPNHYMALYHAGMSEYQLGQHERARANLDAFLRVYTPQDGWRTSALGALAKMGSPTPVEKLPDSSASRDDAASA